jgi:hypothetical protein
LESLAEITQSQDEPIIIDSVQSLDMITRLDTPVNGFNSRVRSTISVNFIIERHNNESLSKPNDLEDMLDGLAFEVKTDIPADTGALPITPRRSATESSVVHRSGGSSVRALAARFGSVKMHAGQTPSPVHTPDLRVWHGTLVEKAVVAPYTVNTSPVPMAQKLTRSDTSLQWIRNPVNAKIRTASPLLQKPLFSGSYVQEDPGPPLANFAPAKHKSSRKY